MVGAELRCRHFRRDRLTGSSRGIMLNCHRRADIFRLVPATCHQHGRISTRPLRSSSASLKEKGL
ncbi:MAG: hypothetical protein MZV70_73215 [Desulfobacterales bacterium]|nr:hypothetical protein [Desulfobacterales bacterium]